MSNNNGSTIPSKIFFITGISRGMGLQLTKTALKRDYAVIGTTRDGTVKGIEPNKNLHIIKLDVNDLEACRNAVNDAFKIYNRLDVIINNAGYGMMGYLEELTPQQIQNNFSTNVFGPITITQAALPYLRKQRSGYIINVSSILGVLASFPSASIYAATKFALTGLSEALSTELEQFNIQVTSIEPGFFRTDFLAKDQKIQEKFVETGILQDYDAKRMDYNKFDKTQRGDPIRAAEIMIELSELEPLKRPIHLILGPDAYDMRIKSIAKIQKEMDQFKETSLSTDLPK
jgi:NAD(P)-dependent dehydrogenase (short-subunit alcohol dehydrogenase family)